MLSNCRTLRAGDLSLTVAPDLGGSITAFQLGDLHLLRPTEPFGGEVRGRDCACFPLVPYSNRIAGGSFTWAGQTHRLSKTSSDGVHATHGNALDAAWRVEGASEQRLEISYRHRASGLGASGRAGWPWPYYATQSFLLSAHELVVTLRLTNLSDSEYPAGLGWHPYFPVREGVALEFQAESVWVNGPDMLPRQLVPAAQLWPEAGIRPIEGLDLNNCFVGWKGAAHIHYPVEDVTLSVIGAMPLNHLVVYAVAGAAAFAVEPVTHMNDAVNRMGEAPDGGLTVLKPGESLEATLLIRVSRSPRS